MTRSVTHITQWPPQSHSPKTISPRKRKKAPGRACRQGHWRTHRAQAHPSRTARPKTQERPRTRDASGAFQTPARGGPRAKDKRPPRARLPSLPRTSSAVLSATAGLTAGFGTGPGDPRLHGRARGGRSPAAGIFSLPRSPSSGATLAAAWRRSFEGASRWLALNEGCEELGLLVALG